VADSEFSGRGPGTLGGGNTESNLTGFSSNAHWAEVQEGGMWSHNPAHPGPKDGFHDPIVAEPARQQIPEAELMASPFPSTSPDDGLTKGF
jgi:hypothetical protein